MNSRPPLQFWSEDGRFGCALDDLQLQRMLAFALKAGRNETGGILVGHYDDEFRLATITVASGPPGGSKAGPAWFERGTRGLAPWLGRLWSVHRHFYLGEWHYHPYASPVPSGTDKAMMERIGASANFCCPEPLLIIIGGDPSVSPAAATYVYPAGSGRTQLLPDRADPVEPSLDPVDLSILPFCK